MAKSLYKIKFNENVDTASLCSVELTANDIKKLQSAIEDLYYFEFIVGKIFDLDSWKIRLRVNCHN